MASDLSLRASLAYEPAELSFGTSGLRGLVRDITQLEAFVSTAGFLADALATGDARPGGEVCIAGDLRPSTDRLVPEQDGRGEILQAVAAAVEGAGLRVVHAGRVPSPALMLHAVRRGVPSVMVTGSHIPFDRNGIKFNRSRGEVLKDDEPRILAAVRAAREREYARPAAESLFDARGMLRPEHRRPLPPVQPEARDEYVRRYVDAFPRGLLAGRRVLVYQHSAVGRDVLVEVLAALGADAVPVARSDRFIPVDTEAVGDEMLAGLQQLVDEAGAGFEALVSTDGDSDRPLVLGVDDGQVRFYGGDLLGIVAADWLGAREIAVPVSATDAIDLHFQPRGLVPVRTRIGSPYVIAAMREVGWEANGGFLTAKPLRVPGGGVLPPLPTRDALLPILCALGASLGRGEPLSALFGRLPARYSRNALLREFPRERALAIVRSLSPTDRRVREARYDESGSVQVDLAEGAPTPTSLLVELAGVRGRLAEFFRAADGFADPVAINYVDGVRIRFRNGEIAHVRPSGNAPELRLYAVAGSPERADAIARLAGGDDGILRRMERATS